jgi:hypothetical protein
VHGQAFLHPKDANSKKETSGALVGSHHQSADFSLMPFVIKGIFFP